MMKGTDLKMGRLESFKAVLCHCPHKQARPATSDYGIYVYLSIGFVWPNVIEIVKIASGPTIFGGDDEGHGLEDVRVVSSLVERYCDHTSRRNPQQAKRLPRLCLPVNRLCMTEFHQNRQKRPKTNYFQRRRWRAWT
jgi:hypothetical protein